MVGFVDVVSKFELVLEDEFGQRYIDATPLVQINDSRNHTYESNLINNMDGSFVIEFTPPQEGTKYVFSLYKLNIKWLRKMTNMC